IAAGRHGFITSSTADDAYVLGDLTRLTQAVANLLNNAAKYTPEGGNIRLTTRASDDFVEIIVSDDGVGIAPEVLPHEFVLFVQARQDVDGTDGGLGIGLALVHKIVNLHGGTVRAASEGVGKGAQFTICLPLHRQTEPLSTTEAHEPARQNIRRVLI